MVIASVNQRDAERDLLEQRLTLVAGSAATTPRADERDDADDCEPGETHRSLSP